MPLTEDELAEDLIAQLPTTAFGGATTHDE